MSLQRKKTLKKKMVKKYKVAISLVLKNSLPYMSITAALFEKNV